MPPWLRRKLIAWFARILDTEEIHEVLRAYSSRAGSNLPAAVAEVENAQSPYRDAPLGGEEQTRQRLREDLVFVTGRFRSGSTALWNVFRHVKGCQAFYEPFNERRFFDPATRGAGTDPTHRGVDDYWREYDGVEGLDELYDEDWLHRNLYMSAGFHAPRMSRFIESLAAQARGRPVMQFNRVDLRLPWLRLQFPRASIVHLYRDPREQWCSFLMNVDEFPAEAPRERFRDRFYLRTWARDLQHAFPFLAGAERQHPYRTFYYLWKLSWLFGRRYADRSIAYETLVARPREELASLFGWLGIEADVDALAGLLVAPREERWRRYASAEWFEGHESACERELEDFFDAAAGLDTLAPRQPSPLGRATA